METASWCGQMGLNFKETGNMDSLMVKANFSFLMEINIMDNGWITNVMAMVHLKTKMEIIMRVIGKMIYKMDRESK
jgi:hypothetical protein